jgi:hypothetical protein
MSNRAVQLSGREGEGVYVDASANYAEMADPNSYV